MLDIREPLAALPQWESQDGRWPLTLGVGARGCHDHLARETGALPQQKSLMFDLATVKGDIQRGHTRSALDSDGEHDCGPLTKEMDTDHMLKTLRTSEWDIRYYVGLVNPKTTSKGNTLQKEKREGGDSERTSAIDHRSAGS